MAKIEFENWMPMPPNMGPPLPKSMGIYWPWYKPVAPPEAPIYACPYCTAEFSTEAELLAHIRDVHAGQPPQVIYVCPHCGARFYSSGELNEHMARVHPPAVPPPPPVVYTCPHCGATFTSEAELNYHIETMHPAAPPPPPPPVYTCPHCGATFASEAELSDHIEAVHPPAPPVVEPRKVSVTLKYPPANSDGWTLGIVAHDLSGSVGGYLTPLGQPVIHEDIPPAWFPLYAFVAAFSNRVPIWQVTSNPSDDWLEWYNPDFIIPSPGNYILNAATGRFEK